MIGRSHPIFGYFGKAFCLADGKDTSNASQETVNQQVGVQGGSGTTITTGASGTTGGDGLTLSHSNLGTSNKGSIDITTSDPEVDEAAAAAGVADSQAAIAGNTAVAQSALASNTQVDQDSLDALAAVAGGSEAVSASVAQSAINASTTAEQMNDVFGEDALEAAENAQATSTGDLETESAQYAAGLLQATANAQTTANNATTGELQPINQAALPTTAQETGTTSLATWVTIIAGVLAIYFYFRKGKA